MYNTFNHNLIRRIFKMTTYQQIMYSGPVTAVVKQIKKSELLSPYPKPKDLKFEQLGEPVQIDKSKTKLPPTAIGTTVDNLVRFLYSAMRGVTELENTGIIYDPILIAAYVGKIDESLFDPTFEKLSYLLTHYEDTVQYRHQVIRYIRYWSAFESMWRSGVYLLPESYEINYYTIEFLDEISQNALKYFESFDHLKTGVIFDRDAFSDIVIKGDADYIKNKNILLDMKCSSVNFTFDQCMQQLVYLFLIQRSSSFTEKIKSFELYNPILNRRLIMSISDFDSDLIDELKEITQLK